MTVKRPEGWRLVALHVTLFIVGQCLLWDGVLWDGVFCDGVYYVVVSIVGRCFVRGTSTRRCTPERRAPHISSLQCLKLPTESSTWGTTQVCLTHRFDLSSLIS